MNDTTIYTLGTAAKALGVTKPTVRKYIDSGDLPATRNGKGHFQIQRCDLETFFPDKLHLTETNHQEDHQILRGYTPSNDPALHLIEQMTSKLEASHRRELDTLENSIRDRDQQIETWKAEAKKNENLLSDQRTEAEKAQSALDAEKAKPQPKITKRKIGFFERLRLKEVIVVEEVA